MTKTQRQQERIEILMEINKKLRKEILKLVIENKKLKHSQIVW